MSEGNETEQTDRKIDGPVGLGKAQTGRKNVIRGVIVAVVLLGCLGLALAWLGAGGKKTDSGTNDGPSASDVATTGSGIAKPSPAKRLDTSPDQTTDAPLPLDASDPQVASDLPDTGDTNGLASGTNAATGPGTDAVNSVDPASAGAAPLIPGAIPAAGGGWQFHADRKGVRNGCKSGILRLTPSRMTFSCDGDSSKDVDVTLDSSVRVDGDGIRISSGEKYHFVVKAQNGGKMIDQGDEATELLFRDWTAGRLPAVPSSTSE